MIGACEYARDERQAGRYPGCWVLHLHGLLVVTETAKRLRRALRKQFPNCDVVKLPVRLTEWDGCEDWLVYWFKAGVSRSLRSLRSGERKYSEGERFRKFGKARKKDRLRSAHRLELLIHRHLTGFDQFLFTRQCQFRPTANGPCLVTQKRRNAKADAIKDRRASLKR
jgi:hypothetical protein